MWQIESKIEKNWKERIQFNLTWSEPSLPIQQLKMLSLSEVVNETQEFGCAKPEIKTSPCHTKGSSGASSKSQVSRSSQEKHPGLPVQVACS